jgi:hypothetical protein
MRALPRTVRGTWALAAAAWVAACAAAWEMLPTRPRAAWTTDEDVQQIGFADGGRSVLTVRASVSSPDNLMPLPTGPLRLWDGDTGRVRTLLPMTAPFDFTAESPDDRWLVFAIRNQAQPGLSILNTATGRVDTLDAVFDRQRSYPYCHFAPGGAVLAYAAQTEGEWCLRLWDLAGGRERVLLPDTEPPRAFSPDGSRFVTIRTNSTDADGRCEYVIWDVARGPAVSRFRQCREGGRIAFAPDGKGLVVVHAVPGSDQSYVAAGWDLEGQVRWSVPIGDGDVDAHFVGSLLEVTGIVDESGRVTTYLDAADGRLRYRRVTPPNSLPHTLPGGRTLQYADGTPQWDALRRRLDPWLNWLPDRAARFHLLDVPTGRHLGSFLPGDGVQSITADGTTMAFVGGRHIELWDIPPRKPLMWFLAAAGLLALPVAWLARRRARALRRRAEAAA